MDTYNDIVKTFTDLSNNILNNSDANEVKILLNNLYSCLSEEDLLEKVDILFVFGSKSTFRTETAI